MKLTDYLLAELDREANRSRAVLQAVPAGQYEWKPHDKSMKFGYLADMVATIPNWIASQVTTDDMDIAPKGGAKMQDKPKATSAALVQGLDESVAAAKTALEQTTDAHLNTAWQLKRGGDVVAEGPRHEMIQDAFNHWAHHRGQLTVYLRLVGAKVPATYGPSADDQTFR